MPPIPNKFYLTTPIYYVNARPHIGHAYSTIAADVIARRHRLLGDDTFFLTGTDEHGQKVQRSAAAAGIPPQQFADEVSATFRKLWARMGITNDDYIRTTEPRHKKGVQALWTLLEERGAIYLSSYTGQYCVSEEIFVEGPPGTIGPDGKATETVTEENYFFKLSEYQLPLINLIESGELHIQPETSKNEILSFLRGDVNNVKSELYAVPLPEGVNVSSGRLEGMIDEFVQKGRLGRSALGNLYVPGALRDLSISRTTFDWGVPVPGNPKHVMYVWLDALANYMTAIGYGSDDPADKAKFARYWPADLHLVGKEITRQHCIYWPAFLMGLRTPDVPETEWNAKWLPKSVVANGWLLFEESKMSKSRGNVVRTETILDAFGRLRPPVPPNLNDAVILGEAKDPCISPAAPQPLTAPTKAQQDLFAADVLRYFLLREIPFGQDGSFSFDALITRYNADLANGYGNLVSRTLKMISNYFAGEIPPVKPEEVELSAFLSNVQSSFFWRDEFQTPLRQDIDGYRFDKYLQTISTFISAIDQVISTAAPWKERSTPAETRANRICALYYAAESIRLVTALLYPILPYATASVWRQLGLGSIEEAARNGELKNLQWGGLKPGTKLGPLAPIFPRADKGLAQIMTEMENPTTPPAPASTPEAKSEPTAESLNAVSPSTEPQPDRTAASRRSPTRRTSNREPRTWTLAHHLHRRLRQNRPPRRADRRRRAHPQGRQAAPSRSGPRTQPQSIPPPDPLRHRRVLHPGRTDRKARRHHRQPRPPQDARPRIPWHAARRLRRRPLQQAHPRHLLRRDRPRVQDPVKVRRYGKLVGNIEESRRHIRHTARSRCLASEYPR
jgi:methionyl-tRNA synthetase